MSDTVREKIQEITDSLYRTGVNDGKNRITYYPKPDETYFSADRLLAIVREAVDEVFQHNYLEDVSDCHSEIIKALS